MPYEFEEPPMRKRFWIGAGIALAVALPVAARAEVVDIAWDAAGRFEKQLTVAPGKFAEVCGKLKPPADVQWQFSANVPLNFNIHYHEGKAVKFPAKQDGVAEGSGKLGVEIRQDYCWMWTNKSASAATLHIKLRRP
jgi:hypothetical protein